MDNGVRLWDLATGKELRRFEAPWSGLGLLAVSGDGRTLAVRGKENNVVLMERKAAGAD
jgi:WD40 repeat protein